LCLCDLVHSLFQVFSSILVYDVVCVALLIILSYMDVYSTKSLNKNTTLHSDKIIHKLLFSNSLFSLPHLLGCTLHINISNSAI
jgi:hypothetical protein